MLEHDAPRHGPHADPDDARYAELIESLYLGRVPAWVDAGQRERVLLASDGRRVAIARGLTLALPRTSYYATALHGSAFVDGVAAALVALPVSSASFPSKLVEATRAWIAGLHDAVLASLVDYDRFVVEMQESRNAEATATFGFDVLAFGALLDEFRAASAQGSIVSRYAPAPRTQRLMATREGDRVTVREAW